MPKNTQNVVPAEQLVQRFLYDLQNLLTKAAAVASLSPRDVKLAIQSLNETSGLTAEELLAKMGVVQRQLLDIKTKLLRK